MLNWKQNQYIWDGHVEQLQALRKDRIYPWFLNLHSEEREYIYIYDRMYQIYLGNCIFIHVYIYTHTHNLWMFFSITFTWCLFFCSKLLHLIFATTMSSGLGLCKVFLWIFAGNQDRKRRQSVDALQEPIEEPTTSRHNGGWHRIEKSDLWMQPNNSSSYLWEVFLKN